MLSLLQMDIMREGGGDGGGEQSTIRTETVEPSRTSQNGVTSHTLT